MSIPHAFKFIVSGSVNTGARELSEEEKIKPETAVESAGKKTGMLGTHRKELYKKATA